MKDKHARAIQFIEDVLDVVADYGKDKTPGGDAMCWLYNNQDELELVLRMLEEGQRRCRRQK